MMNRLSVYTIEERLAQLVAHGYPYCGVRLRKHGGCPYLEYWHDLQQIIVFEVFIGDDTDEDLALEHVTKCAQKAEKELRKEGHDFEIDVTTYP
jgi:hypothetical protein